MHCNIHSPNPPHTVRRRAEQRRAHTAEPADSAGTHSSLAASPSLPPLGVERMGAHLPSLAASLPRCPPCLPHHPHPKRARAFSPSVCAVCGLLAHGVFGCFFFSPPLPLLLLVNALGSSCGTISGSQGRTVADGTLPKPTKRCAKIRNTLRYLTRLARLT